MESIKYAKVKNVTYSLLEDVGVFRKQNCANDASLVLGSLEVRIRIEKEHLLQLVLVEVMRQVFHGIGADASYVPVAAGVLRSEGLDAVYYIVGHLDPNLHAQRQAVRKHIR